MNTQEYQNVEIYLDYATIPSLNYFFHFIHNYQDYDSIRLFGLSRFSISEKIISMYPKDKIFFEKIHDGKQDKFNECFKQIAINSDKKLKVNIHLNLAHAFKMIIPLLSIYFQNKNKFYNLELFFYDDGSEGIMNLYNLLSKPHLEESITYNIEQFKNFEEKQSFSIKENTIARYLWGFFKKSHYYLLNTEILKNKKLLFLKSKIENLNNIDFEQYDKFNETQKDLLLEILNIPYSTIQIYKNIFSNFKTFIFVGTTIFNQTQKFIYDIENAHINAIKQITTKSGALFKNKNDYLIYYKGHPNATVMNQKIEKEFRHLNIIPSNIPMEILYFLGIKPTQIGGFASTSYFNIEKSIISDLIFITSKDIKNENNFLLEDQLTLMNIFKELDYISNEQIYFYQDFI